MTIDSTKPLATDLISSIDNYIREDREQINDLWRAIVAANATETDHNMGAGEFYLEIGSDLDDVILELVNLTASVAVNLMQITNGSGGMVKVIRAGDSNVTVVHNASYIHTLSEANITMVAGDMLVLMNKGGDPDTSVNGVWYELLSAGSSTGEANTASNVGTGDGEIFKQKTGVDLELRTIKAGANITVTNNASDITLSAASGGSGENAYSTAVLGTGDTELVGGTDVSAEALTEVVSLSAVAAETLETISGCTSGGVKYIIADGNNISVKKSSHMMICQPDADDTFEMSDGDILELVNFGGNPGISNGVWYESSRTFAV